MVCNEYKGGNAIWESEVGIGRNILDNLAVRVVDVHLWHTSLLKVVRYMDWHENKYCRTHQKVKATSHFILNTSISGVEWQSQNTLLVVNNESLCKINLTIS
jgi:hypothetical protein